MTNERVEYVTVREWQQGRSDDRAEMRRLVIETIKGTEERLLRAFEKSERDRDRLASAIDAVQSVLDQQRGARNLILFLIGTNLITVAITVAIFVTNS